MNNLLKILEEHCELLRDRGYEEIGLGTLEEPGVYLKQMEQIFSYNIQEAQFNKSIREFDVRGIGFFNEEKDPIDFLFHYELNPAQGKIKLKSFTAKMDGVAKGFILEQGMYKLPPVSKVISILSEGRKASLHNADVSETKQSETDTTAIIKKMLEEHCTLLGHKGYTSKEYFPYSDNFLFKKLEHKLVSKYAIENPTPDFLIRMQGFFNDQNDEVKYSFFYSIDQTNNALQINLLVADLHDKRTCYTVNEVNSLPAAENVWKHLNNTPKEEKVEVIFPKEKIKILLREQEHVLGSLGYYKTLFDNNSNFIERELHGILLKSLNENERQIIPINRNIHLNVNDKMNCRFQYSFDPVTVQLQLDSVTAKVGIVERTYSSAEIENQKIVLNGIFDELNGQNRLLNARKISEGPPERSGMKAMVKHLQKRSF